MLVLKSTHDRQKAITADYRASLTAAETRLAEASRQNARLAQTVGEQREIIEQQSAEIQRLHDLVRERPVRGERGRFVKRVA